MPAGPLGMAIFASRPKLRLRPTRRANISTPIVLQALCASDASRVPRTWWFVFVLLGTGCVKAGAASGGRSVVVILVHVAMIRQDPLLDAFVLEPMRCKLVSVVWHRILHILRHRHAFSHCARRCINAMATSTGPLVIPTVGIGRGSLHHPDCTRPPFFLGYRVTTSRRLDSVKSRMVRSGTLCRNATPPPKPEYRVESVSPVKDIEWGSLFGSTRFPNLGGQSRCPLKLSAMTRVKM